MDDERFEYRALVIPTRDHLSTRQAILQAHSDFTKEFGPGWEFEGSIPGAVSSGQHSTERHAPDSLGTVLLFRRRKQQRVTGVSIGP
jgi:hypothetical protein